VNLNHKPLPCRSPLLLHSVPELRYLVRTRLWMYVTVEGGQDNFAADKEAAERVLAAAPGLRFRVRANRAFLGQAVRYLAAEAGIRQFRDVGTGSRRPTTRMR
jgi:S-adenosyl methyltransferase